MIEALAVARMAGAGVVIAGFLLAATYLIDGRVSSRRGRSADYWCAAALIVIAGFVWLRAIDRPDDEGRAAYYVAIAAGVPAVVWLLRRSQSVLRLVRAAAESTELSRALAVTGAIVLLAAPIALTPIALHWDASGWMDSHSYDAFANNIAIGKIVEGNSAYMPVYQYGMALVYYAFGHFFFAQQIVNLVFALAAVAAVTLAAWILFDSSAATMVAGVLAVYSTPLFYALHFTQIETWFTPIVCLLLLSWAVYWRSPSMAAAAILALMLGLGINTRNQGALFFAFLAATPLFIRVMPWRVKLSHAGLIGAIVLVSLIPWTVRNMLIEGRFSPFGSRSAMYIGILSDPRIGLYGIRYWEGWEEIAAEYRMRHPEAVDRENAYFRAAWANLTRDPLWTARALAWRSAAFYGLLRDGFIESSGVRPANWPREWRSFLFSRSTALLLVSLSVVALIASRNRTLQMLSGAIVASLAIVIVSASSEERVSYPVLPVHMLMAAALFRSRTADATEKTIALRPSWRIGLIACATLAIVIAGGRSTLGAEFAYRPLIEPSLTIAPGKVIDTQLPLLRASGELPVEGVAAGIEIGRRIRIRCMVTNYMFPPKHAGAVPEVPAFASDPQSAQYFFAYLLSDDDQPSLTRAIGVTFHNATQHEQIREGDAVEIQGVIRHGASAGDTALWLSAEHIRRLPFARSEMPPFP